MLNLDLMKLKSLLQQSPDQGVMPTTDDQAPVLPQQQNQQPTIPPFDTGDNQLQQMLNPKDEQFNRFVQLLQQIPQKQNFQPSGMRKFAGFMANLGSGSPLGISGGQPIGYKSDIAGGFKNQQMINDEPYNSAVQEWLRKSEPTLESAKLENTRNVNQRIGASNIRTAQLREEGLSRQRNWDTVKQADLEEKQRQGQEKIDTSKQRAAAYTWDKEHPNHTYREDAEGNIFSVDPKTDETQYLFDQEGNKIKSKNLSDEMKMKIRHEDTMSEIGARGNEARKTEDVRAGNRGNLEDQKTENKVKTATTRTGAAAKPETEAARHLRQFDLAVKAINEHPEWNEYIHLDAPHKIFKVDTPESKTGFFGLGAKKAGDPAIAKKILDYVYGNDKVSNQQSAAPARKELTRATTRADGKTHVKNKTTGETGWVTNPNSDKYELIP